MKMESDRFSSVVFIHNSSGGGGGVAKIRTIEKIVKRNLGQKATVSRPEDAKDKGRLHVTVPYNMAAG